MTQRQPPRPKKASQGETETPPYRPPQRLLDRCPGCGCVVLRGVAMPGGTIRRLDPPVTPALGLPHSCDEALAREVTVQGQRWNTVRIVAEQRRLGTQEGA